MFNWIRCLFGKHDWEILEWRKTDNLDSSRVYKKICLNCGKKNDTLTPFIQNGADYRAEQIRRKELAKKMWVEYV